MILKKWAEPKNYWAKDILDDYRRLVKSAFWPVLWPFAHFLPTFVFKSGHEKT